jgi:3-hydroxyisobutyrate dehydrogenase-like beta-hydroxyacid dehydrogenase
MVGPPFVRYKAGPLLADDNGPTFGTGLMRKDLDRILAPAAASAVPLPVTGTAYQLPQA